MLHDFWVTFRGKKAPPPPSPFFVASLPSIDPDEDIADEKDVDAASDDLLSISGYCCIINYRDAQGNSSERRITCHRYEIAGKIGYIRALCHEREAKRQFRIDRIELVTDLITGEVQSAEEFISQFRADSVTESKFGWGLSVRRRADLVAGLNTLAFIARCDKEWHSLEASATEDFIARMWLRCEWDGEPPVADIVTYSKRLAPDAEDFYGALLRCQGNPNLAKLVRQSIREVIDADGLIRPEESYWGSKVDSFFTSGVAD